MKTKIVNVFWGLILVLGGGLFLALNLGYVVSLSPVFWMAVFAGLGVIALGQITATWMGFVLMLVLGVGNGYLGISLITAIQSRTPRELLGRIMGLVMLATIGLVPIGQSLAGALRRWNVSILMAVGGVGMILLAVWLLGQTGLELMATPLAAGVSPEPASQD